MVEWRGSRGLVSALPGHVFAVRFRRPVLRNLEAGKYHIAVRAPVAAAERYPPALHHLLESRTRARCVYPLAVALGAAPPAGSIRPAPSARDAEAFEPQRNDGRRASCRVPESFLPPLHLPDRQHRSRQRRLPGGTWRRLRKVTRKGTGGARAFASCCRRLCRAAGPRSPPAWSPRAFDVRHLTASGVDDRNETARNAPLHVRIRRRRRNRGGVPSGS